MGLLNMKQINGWVVLSPRHISRNFETSDEAIAEALELRLYAEALIEVTLKRSSEYTITIRQTTVHVNVK